jgi:hypothetical protein
MTKKLVAILAVCCAAILPYISSLDTYFTGDDFGFVQLFSRKPPLHFLTLFTASWAEDIWGGVSDELRPTLALSYQIGSLGDAGSPVGNHVINIALHVANALLVLAIARLVAGLSLPASAFAGMLFAVLPIHAETVTWISGRADSLPTLFYLGSFLAYARWRRRGAAWLYLSSVGLFFLALFSKQSAITMVATLLLYDLLVERQRVRLSWPSLRPYVPFVLLTGAYLIERYVLFGNVVRETDYSINRQLFIDFTYSQIKHLQWLVFGSVALRQGALREIAGPGFPVRLTWVGLAAALLFLAWADWRMRRSVREGVGTARGLLWYFGPVWWLVGTVPLIVTYESARHLYLASVGFAIVLGLGFDALWNARQPLWRYAGALGGAGLVLAYTLKLLPGVAEWNTAGSISEKMVRDAERQAAAAPAGSLLVLDPPAFAASKLSPLVWVWSLPYALRPPFTRTDVTERSSIIWPVKVHCCERKWLDRTRRAIDRWSKQTDRPPVVAMRWDAATGALTRQSDRADGRLRDQILGLSAASNNEEADKTLSTILSRMRQAEGDVFRATFIGGVSKLAAKSKPTHGSN